MPKEDYHGCVTCKWGRFIMIDSDPPRPSTEHPGTCMIPTDKLPAWTMPLSTAQSRAVFVDTIYCPVWERKE